MTITTSPSSSDDNDKKKKKKVIIVGGGIAGFHTAKALLHGYHSNLDVTIIDRQDYLDWSLASPRSVVSPDDVTKYHYMFPQDKLCQIYSCNFSSRKCKNN